MEWCGVEGRRGTAKQNRPRGGIPKALTRGVQHPDHDNVLLSRRHCRVNDKNEDAGPYVAVRPPRVELTRAPPPQICAPIHARQGAAGDGDGDGRAVRFPPAPVVTDRRQQLQP